MIIKQEDAGAPSSKAAEATRDAPAKSTVGIRSFLRIFLTVLKEELPPPYTSTVGTTSTSSLRPSNFLSIHETNKRIKGTYLIDPKMVIPSSMLPASRRNLSLSTTNGSIDADVTLLPADDRATIYMKSTNGQVRIKLVRKTILWQRRPAKPL